MFVSPTAVLEPGQVIRKRCSKDNWTKQTYLNKYADQKASTARTCNLRDLVEGRPSK